MSSDGVASLEKNFEGCYSSLIYRKLVNSCNKYLQLHAPLVSKHREDSTCCSRNFWISLLIFLPKTYLPSYEFFLQTLNAQIACSKTVQFQTVRKNFKNIFLPISMILNLSPVRNLLRSTKLKPPTERTYSLHSCHSPKI
jgi:hypothetical protein